MTNAPSACVISWMNEDCHDVPARPSCHRGANRFEFEISHDRTDASSDLLVRVRTCTYAYECRGAGEVYTSNREVLPIFFPGRVVYGSVVCTAPHRPGGVYILCIPVEVYRSVLYSYTLLYFHFFWLLISTLLPYLYVVPVQYSY